MGWHPGWTGSFILYEFRDAPPVVHFEHYSSGAFVTNEHDISKYRKAIELLRGIAYRQPEYLAEICRGFSLVGDHEQGVTHLSDRANVVDAEKSERDLVLYHAYAGEAFLGLGELDAAASHGQHALTLLGEDISSERALKYVVNLADQLKERHGNAAVREFVDRVAESTS